MKKIAVLAIVLSLFLGGNVFAQHAGWSIGGSYSFDWMGGSATGGAAALCLKFPQLPIMFGVSAIMQGPLMIGVTADWWLFQTALVGPVSLYIGPGIFIRLAQGAPAFGIRIPFGFQIFILPVFEIFLEPALAIGLIPVLPAFGMQAALGFRFWF